MHCRAVLVTICTARGLRCRRSPATAALLMHVGLTARPVQRARVDHIIFDPISNIRLRRVINTSASTPARVDARRIDRQACAA